MALRFSVYYHSRENGEHLRQLVNFSGTGLLVVAKDLEHLPAVSDNNDADVFIIEYQENDPQLDQWLETAAADPHSPAVFLAFKEIAAAQLWKALRLGVKECFAIPIKPEEFLEAVNRLLTRTTLIQSTRVPTKIISFLGCKGGIGTSFLAANLAYLLSREHNGQVLLMDLDLQYGQLVYFFDAQPQHTLNEVIAHLDEMDHVYLQSLLYPYNKSLSLLPAPTRLEEAEAVTSEHLDRILTYLKNLHAFRWLLLDAGHRLDEITLKSLELSDSLVLVTAPSVPALANAKKWLELLGLSGLDMLPMELWLNAWDRNTDLTLPEVAKYLGVEVNYTMPFDIQEVNRSINDGRPLAETNPRCPLSRALQAKADKLLGQEALKVTDSSGWGWLKRLGGRS